MSKPSLDDILNALKITVALDRIKAMEREHELDQLLANLEARANPRPYDEGWKRKPRKHPRPAAPDRARP